MRRSLIISAAAGVLVLMLTAGTPTAGAEQAAPPDAPPVAQPLVREGDFAIKLAEAYELGSPASETEAEDLLAQAGIVPLNGWLSDYPVTPEILGQLQEAAARAASERKLAMGPDESVRRLHDVAAKMNLPVPAAPEDAGPGGKAVYPPPALYNYYDGYGPPIITYYPPPPAYLYLYAWVPYPLWWYGYWYPGFYICHSFSTTIMVGSRTVVVRNRFVDPVTRQVIWVDPVVRTGQDAGRSRTVLRTQDGSTYSTMRDLRAGTSSGRAADGGGSISSRPPGQGGYRTPHDRQSAGQIYQRSLDRKRSTSHSVRPGSDVTRRSDEGRRGTQGATGTYTVPPQGGKRSYEQRTDGAESSTGTQRQQRHYEQEEQGQGQRFDRRDTIPGWQGRSNEPKQQHRSRDQDGNGQGGFRR